MLGGGSPTMKCSENVSVVCTTVLFAPLILAGQSCGFVGKSELLISSAGVLDVAEVPSDTAFFV